MSFLDSARNRMSTLSSGARPPLEGLYIYLLCALIGYGIADLSVMSARSTMLPTKAPQQRPEVPPKVKTSVDYAIIARRNVFSADGVIPPPLSRGKKRQDLDGPAVRSQLPLKLLGTIVHANPNKSVATINMSNRNKTESFKVTEDIPGMAQITKIERRKVIFRNSNNGRLEYIEIPKDSQITFGLKAPQQKSGDGGDTAIQKEGEYSYSIKRSDLDKYTSDLPSILKQARMVPNIVPNSGGQIDGFRFVSIKPGSVFEKLGFKPGDIIKGVDGEAVTSPTQAMEMYQALKSKSRLSLDVNRGGSDETFDYSIE